MPSPLTIRDKELLEMSSVMSQFPITFASKDQWSEFNGECSCCGKTLPNEFVRGIVSRPIQSVAVIEAVGVCSSCKLVTRFDYRLHDDMRLTGQREDGWQTWKASPTLLDRLNSMFKRAFS